jgi:hypothetical protein
MSGNLLGMSQLARDQPCKEQCGRLVGKQGGKGRCGACAQRERRRLYREAPEPCVIEGCITGRRLGMKHCDMHYSRIRRYGDPGGAASKIGPRGGGSLKQDGYHVTKVDGRQVGTHRLVMEQRLGRKLHPWETVHHKNGRRAWNDPDNLELWAKAQPYGQRVTDLIEFIVKHYRGDVLAALSRED